MMWNPLVVLAETIKEKDSYNYWDSAGFLWVMIPFFVVLVLIVVCVLIERRHKMKRKNS